MKKTLSKKASITGLLLAGLLTWQSSHAADVTIAYQGIINPYKTLVANKEKIEEKTGLTVEFRQFDSGARVITALASGSVDIGTAGSSPIAAGISQGVPIDLFWILENINDAEALVVRNGSDIHSPQDLRGKKIGVPFVSTTHFHTLFALEQFGLSESDVELINLQPNAIHAAWERGDIDAAFVWDPALGRIKETGNVLITSGELGRWGKATFDGLVVHKDFAEKHPEFLTAFVSLIAEADAEYKAQANTLDDKSPLVLDIVNTIGAEATTVPGVLALYDFPELEEQASSTWLGGEKTGGAAQALRFTAEFLHQQGNIPAVLDDYSSHVNPSFAQAALNK